MGAGGQWAGPGREADAVPEGGSGNGLPVLEVSRRLGRKGINEAADTYGAPHPGPH
ncbi:hypothetical protein SY2F82_68200 [Streptomyces sp. Y2F8-2]|nr:hypothetical protein SY2F82_68200 [Streptomyces sp. Y2F8-2]